MNTPQSLQNGDSIAIVAPSGKVKLGTLDHAIHILNSWGLEVILGQNLYTDSHSYLAGSDDERLSDLQWALDNKNIKAIFCARGGYGVTRILDRINFSGIQSNVKWLIGFSDITALHIALCNLGIESIHGIMPKLFDKEDAESSIAALKELLFGGESSIHTPYQLENRCGRVTGKLVGGNLSLLVDAIGTAYDLTTQNKILFLEEVDEPSYKIDRMLTHLKRAGKLEGLAGLVIGQITGAYTNNTTFKDTLEEIIMDKVANYNYPVGFNLPIGHVQPNLAFRHGANYMLDVSENETVLKQLTAFN